MLTIERLRPGQLNEAVEAITGGFAEERNFAAIFPNRKCLLLLMRAMTRVAIRHGGAYAAREDGQIIGGVVGYPPGVYPFALSQELRLAPMYVHMFLLSPRSALRLLRMYHAELQHHPTGERYWYLFAVAVRPGDRSLRTLQQLFVAVMGRVDADGAAALLETAHPELAFGVRRYFDFTVREEGVQIVKNGPRNWYLWRPAR